MRPASRVEASHDGYMPRFSLIHARKLHLDATGTRLDGVDSLSPAKGVLRFAWDLPFAIRFHLHPEAEASIGQSPDIAELALETGELWRLVGHRRRPVDRGQHLFRRHHRVRVPPSASRCARCAAAPPRSPGGSSAYVRAARWTPRRASASAQKSGKPRRIAL